MTILNNYGKIFGNNIESVPTKIVVIKKDFNKYRSGGEQFL